MGPKENNILIMDRNFSISIYWKYAEKIKEQGLNLKKVKCDNDKIICVPWLLFELGTLKKKWWMGCLNVGELWILYVN